MIGFAGLSHLGLNYSLATAAKGFDVLAFDPDSSLVAQLGRGVFPIEEPGFAELFAASRERLRYTADASELQRCDLVFFSLDIVTNERNESDLSPLTRLIDRTAPMLRKGATAVVLSQVRPGYTRALTARFGPQGVSLFYQVETLIFGAAVKRANEPERFIVGASDPGAPLPPRYREWLDAFGCPVLVMRYESAELAKIAINLFLVSTITTTNTLAELCEAIGADWAEIAPALKLDRRIGPHAYLKPGLGIAGGNLERDVATLRSLAAERGTEAGVAESWRRSSDRAKTWALRAIKRELLGQKAKARIAVWGLAYKEDTHSVRNSAAIEFIQDLKECEMHAYDPAARMDVSAYPNLKIHATALDALSDSDALAVMTPWAEFASVAPAEIRARMRGDLVIDPYGMLQRRAATAAGLRHLVLGAGH
jgi:UDPglucose 6-dehydrogenase